MRALVLWLTGIAVAIVSLPATEGQASQRMSLEQVVTRREPALCAISPDGRRVAYVVRQGRLSSNDYEYTLWVRADDAPPVPAFQSADEIESLVWSHDGAALYFLGRRHEKPVLQKVAPSSHAVPEVVNLGDDEPLAFSWSPDGKTLAYVCRESPSATSQQGGSIAYDPRRRPTDTARGQAGTRLMVWSGNSDRHELWRCDSVIGDLSWNPGSGSIAFCFGEEPDLGKEPATERDLFPRAVVVVRIADGHGERVLSHVGWLTQPRWSPDGSKIACELGGHFTDLTGILVVDLGQHRQRLYPLSVPSGGHLSWSPDGNEILMKNEDAGLPDRSGAAGLYRVDLATGRSVKASPGDDHLSGFSFAADGDQFACVQENSNRPPEVALGRLSTNEMRPVTNLNPDLAEFAPLSVRRWQWTNRFGDETSGWLVSADGDSSPARRPLLVMFYGFSGQYLADAEWITSFPIRAFAESGFRVLLLNYPRTRSWNRGDFDAADRAVAGSATASVEDAIKQLEAEGLVEAQKLGILGLSHGGFLTAYVITHSRLPFKAAAIIDGGSKYSPALYLADAWTGRQYTALVLGGSPFAGAAALARWQQFSPNLRADRVQAAVLMEFNAREADYAVDQFNAFREAGVPVDFRIYPGERHIFFQPRNRVESMQRNLSWFRFWLQDVVSSGEEGERWAALRANRHPVESR